MQSQYSTPAIVLGLSVNGLGVIRSLGRQGVPVYAMDYAPNRSARFSRYAKFIACPDAAKDPPGFTDFLLNFTKKLGGSAVLLPTGDNFNEFVNTHRAALSPALKFAMPPQDVMDQLLNKRGQYELALRHGVPVPPTFFPTTPAEVRDLAPGLRYPVLFKGLSTGGWRKRFGDQKAVVVKDARELVGAYEMIHQGEPLETIIQEIIPGDDSRHYKICAYMSREGNPLLTFTLRKIRQYPCDFGIGSSVVSVWVPELADLGLPFLKAIHYWGVGSIEFKKDMRDDRWKMIEINPRLWAQNSLPDACGQNFALTAYLDALGKPVVPRSDFKEGVKWIAMNTDFVSFRGYRAQGRMSWAQWLTSVLTGKRVWAVWSADDPMPWVQELLVGKVWNKIKKILKLKSSGPHE